MWFEGLNIVRAWMVINKVLLTLNSLNFILKGSVVWTYKFFATVEMFVEGFHVTNGKSLDAASILYFSLLLMMSSSLKLISAIFLDRWCRMLTCVVNPEKNQTMDWLQFGYLQKRKTHSIRFQIYTKIFGSYQKARSLDKEGCCASNTDLNHCQTICLQKRLLWDHVMKIWFEMKLTFQNDWNFGIGNVHVLLIYACDSMVIWYCHMIRSCEVGNWIK
jgi:hypothetical protein